jgi:hypothetical protein
VREETADAVGVALVRRHTGELDDAVREDLDRVGEQAQLMLVRGGFWLAAERGGRLLFVAPRITGAQARAAVTAASRAVAARPDPDPRVIVAWCVHRAPVTMRAETAVGGPLFDVDRWAMSDAPAGVWFSPSV